MFAAGNHQARGSVDDSLLSSQTAATGDCPFALVCLFMQTVQLRQLLGGKRDQLADGIALRLRHGSPRADPVAGPCDP